MSQLIEITERMQAFIQQWTETGDRRTVFLRCYLLMTQNMRSALTAGQFHDSAWVGVLLDHFAEYYFLALNAYEDQNVAIPPVWEVAHDATHNPQVSALQCLVLGVNAHINYDLVLVVVDLLASEWDQLSAIQRQQRYADYCHVNDVIASSIDAVQASILAPVEPVLEVADVVMGRADEWFISRLITHWRERVWQDAQQMLALLDDAGREMLRRQLETSTLAKADAIMFVDGPWGLAKLL